ncbi:hypothetical protein ACLF81_07505, partial [Helicobacter pylori]
FLSFGENFIIFLILTLFVSFGGKTMVKRCFNETHFLKFETHFLKFETRFFKFETRFFKGIGGYYRKIPPLTPLKSP